MQKLFAIRLLLGYVLGNAHRSHELPLLIIERCLQGNHFPHAVLAHDMLPKAAGPAGLLHILLSFQADKPAELVFFLAESSCFYHGVQHGSQLFHSYVMVFFFEDAILFTVDAIIVTSLVQSDI